MNTDSLLNNNEYIPTSGNGDYGPRVWVRSEVQVEYEALCEALNRLSKWGGIDKRLGAEVSWEFSENDMPVVHRVMKAFGMVNVSA